MLKAVFEIAGVFLSLYCPALYRLVQARKHSHLVAPIFFYLLFMTWGGTPTAISVALHYTLLPLKGLESLGVLLLTLVVWILAPFLVKPIGWHLVLRGAPHNKFTTPPLWVLYCDVAFGTLGLVLFVRTPTTSLTYAASIIPILLLHLLRGTHFSLSCCNTTAVLPGVRRAAQLNIFLEAFSAVLGRAAAYTVYFCMLGMRLIAGNVDPVVMRPTLLEPGRFVKSVSAVQIYRRSPGGMKDLVAAFFGCTLLWCAFYMFCWLLPGLWTKQGAVAPSASHDTGEWKPKLDTGNLQATAPDSEVEAGVSWAQPRDDPHKYGTESAGWVLGENRRRTQRQQYQLLVSFIDVHKHSILALVLFQFMICTAAVNLAEAVASGSQDGTCGISD